MRPISLLVLCCLLPAACSAQSDQQTEFFETHIRPLLVERCYHCHNSAEDAQGGLALDFRDGLLRGGDGGSVIVPGDPGKSRLLAILRHEIDGLEMPEDSGKLSESEIAAFEEWIRTGAADPRDAPPSAEALAKATSWETKLRERRKWWSFQPIREHLLPSVRNTDWSRQAIDRFVLARLEAAGLNPAPRAESAVLVRRAWFTLIGLPPTIDESRHWTARLEERPRAAFAEMIDHLLNSPHFGERWARHWMDWIRYAESHGSEGDPRIDNAWHYRDYLIRALNADVPFDQLLREHVAGDLLDTPRINTELGINESVIGPAHLRMVFHGFAPTDALDEKVRFTDDQINAFSKAFLGLTVSCARCHDHKFDAISQRDYYALFGIFGSTRPARQVIDLPAETNRHREELSRLKTEIRTGVSEHWIGQIDDLPERLRQNEALWKTAEKRGNVLHTWFQAKQQAAAGQPIGDAWLALEKAARKASVKAQSFAEPSAKHAWNLSTKRDYAQWFPKGSGLPPQPHSAGGFSVATDGDLVLSGIYPAGIYSHELSAKHAARLTSPDVMLDGDYDVWIRAIGSGGAATRYVVQNYPRNGTVFPVTQLKPEWKWHRFNLNYWNGDRIHIELTTAQDAPLLVKNQPRSWFGIREAVIVPAGHAAPPDQPDFDNALFTVPIPESVDDIGQVYAFAIDRAVRGWADGSAGDSQALLLDACLKQGVLSNSLSALPAALQKSIARYRQLEGEIKTPTRVPGLDETIARDQPLFVRGNHRKPGEVVPRRFLEAIDAAPYNTQRSGRRQLAEDLLRDDNPLTRRVIVNRIWHHLFGRGIVSTPDNFGRLGDKPSHPMLLDDLARRLEVEHHWSLKQLIREIVTSETWQQSSTPSDAALRQDPANRLLSHANVRRLEAEAIRDALLQVSGRLDRSAFGAPVGGNTPRRSIYVSVIRNSLDPFLRAFDFPEPFSCTGRRDITNVPAQSLMLMNDPAITGYAASWVRTVLAAKTTDADRISLMFRSAFGRDPSADEVSRAADYLSETRDHFRTQHQKLAALKQDLAAARGQLTEIIAPVRERLEQAASEGHTQPALQVPPPISEWDFARGLRDMIGDADCQAKGGAKQDKNGLVVTAGGHAVTSPLKVTLREKTLEAWVQLDNLNQRGGGVMTVQTPNGVVFDSIVFAEKTPQRWLAGSNNFQRTQSFAGAPEETEAVSRPVHVAIAYDADGTVRGYRDGQPYGNPYKSNGPQEFKAGNSVVSFGVRHLPAVGNRLLAGRVLRARLYDRALTSEQIAATSQSASYFVSDAAVLAELSDADRNRVAALRQRVAQLTRRLKASGDVPDPGNDQAVWSDLARAMFTFKEFLYLR